MAFQLNSVYHILPSSQTDFFLSEITNLIKAQEGKKRIYLRFVSQLLHKTRPFDQDQKKRTK